MKVEDVVLMIVVILVGVFIGLCLHKILTDPQLAITNCVQLNASEYKCTVTRG